MSLQLIANVAVLAAIYALVSTGYILVYRVSRVLNLAHGELMMLGGYLLLATASSFGGHPVIAIGAAVGLSLLEASTMYEMPHAGVCGGRGRCGTCRVSVLDGRENLPPPSAVEPSVRNRS